MSEQAVHDPVEAPVPALDEVRALVQERERFEAWLAALEARRATTPEKVHARVYADYAARRDGVLRALAAHVGPLERHAAELSARLAALAGERESHAETRAEAELRHTVGEYSDEQWESVRSTVDAALADLEVADEILRHDRADVEHLLEAARRGEPAAPPAEPATVASADARPASIGGEGEVGGVEPVAATGAASTPAADLLAQEEDAPAITEEPEAMRPVAPAPAEAAEIFTAGSAAAAAPSADDEIEAAWEESAARGFGVDDVRPGRVTQEVAALESFEVFTGPNAAVPPAAPAEPATGKFDDLAFLRSLTVNSEATKTLRCTECGTMNFPTEWYCERCGGELAAL